MQARAKGLTMVAYFMPSILLTHDRDVCFSSSCCKQLAKLGMRLDVFINVPTKRDDFPLLGTRKFQCGLYDARSEAAPAQGWRRQRVIERHHAGREAILGENRLAIDVEFETVVCCIMDDVVQAAAPSVMAGI
jgi:hypothetical protein